MNKLQQIIDIFRNWLESRNLSWILPKRNEHPQDALIASIELLVISLIILPLLVIRLLELCYNLLPFKNRLYIEQRTHHFIYASKQVDLKNYIKAQISRPVVRCFLLCFFLSVLAFCTIPHLHLKAKQANLRVIEKIYDENTDIDIDYLLPNDNEEQFFSSVLSNIYEARKRDYSGKDVIEVRNQLSIDENFVKDLYFSDKDDFLSYLFSLKGIDEDVDNYLNDVEKLNDIEGFIEDIRQSIVDDYKIGFFYTARAKTDYYFNLYINQNIFPVSDIDNTMHSLRLLLSHRSDLSSHRDFARMAYYCLAEDGIIDTQKLKKASRDNSFFNDVALYCEGVLSFRRDSYVNAMNCFENCFEKTNDDLLRQYSALMCIRTAFWNFDQKRTHDELLKYEQTYSKYSYAITLPYFIPDLKRYETVVAEIKNNPKFEF